MNAFTNPLVKPSSSVFVTSKVPQFVRDSYPLFTEFMQAYYQWLDTQSPRDFETILDIETTFPQFLTYFGKELSYLASQMQGLEPAQFIELSRQMFAAKGTPDAFNLLFQLLGLAMPQIRYPRDNIFCLSQSSWNQDKSFFVDLGTTFTYKQLASINIAMVSYKTYTIPVQINRVVLVSGTIYEFFLNPGWAIPFDAVYNNVTFDGIAGNYSILPTLLIASQSQIFNGGSGFKAGQVFTVTNPVLTPITLKVNQVDSNGSILSMSAIRFGVLPSSSNSMFVLYNSSTQQTAFNPFSDTMGNFSEYVTITNNDYWVIDSTNNYQNQYGQTNYVGTFITSYGSSASNNGSTFDGAVLNVVPVAMAVYPGYYSSNQSMLSDLSCVLQDGFLYQQFSYIINTIDQFVEYGQIAQKYLHPAGTLMFSNYNIVTQQDYNLTPTTTLR